jgi:hypothetical protein
MPTLIQTFKLNSVDRQAWLADVLAQIAEHETTILAGCCLRELTNGKSLVSQIGGLAYFLEMTLIIEAATPMRGSWDLG